MVTDHRRNGYLPLCEYPMVVALMVVLFFIILSFFFNITLRPTALAQYAFPFSKAFLDMVLPQTGHFSTRNSQGQNHTRIFDRRKKVRPFGDAFNKVPPTIGTDAPCFFKKGLCF